MPIRLSGQATQNIDRRFNHSLDSGKKIQQQTAQLERKNDAVEVAPEPGRTSPDDRFHLARETQTNEKTLSDTKTDRGASTSIERSAMPRFRRRKVEASRFPTLIHSIAPSKRI